MTDLLTDLGKIAGVLALLGYIPYLISIVRRKTLPNPATWWIWSIMGGILFASYYLEGNREAIWVPLSYFIGPTVTGILSLKYGRSEFGNFEKYCLAGAATSLLLWYISGPILALTMLIMIDLIAIAPTLRKTYFKPDSEDPLAWSIFWLANTINLYVVLASEAPTYAAIAYPLELFFLPTSIMTLVIRGKVFGISRPQKQQLQAAFATPPANPQQTHHPAPAAPVAPTAASTKTSAFNSAPSSTFNEPFDESLNQLIRQGARQIISKAVAEELNELLAQQGIPQIDNLSTHSTTNTDPQHTISRKEENNTHKAVPSAHQADAFATASTHQATHNTIQLTSQHLPPYLQNSHTPEDILPWLYLKGITQPNISKQCENLIGTTAKTLSADTISQIENTWCEEHQTWRTRNLSHQRYVYIWADGIYFEHSEDSISGILAIVGIRADGYLELLGLEAGHPKSVEDWQTLLLQLQSQGFQSAPHLAIGNSKLGFWRALNQVFPTAQRQECWSRKTADILRQLPTKLQPKVDKALWEIYRAETKLDAKEALEQFVKTYRTKYPEATEHLTTQQEALLAFYDFPAEHWPSIRNNSLIDSIFATLRMNTVNSLGESLNQVPYRAIAQDTDLAQPHALSPAAFTLAQSATKQWHRIRGAKYLGDVIEGITFPDGSRSESTVDDSLKPQTAA
ncbi:MAG: IS256 family transposase [Cyanobacteria bacterium P01_C01_bin.121]